MSIKKYFIFMLIGTFVCAMAFTFTTLFMNPKSDGWVALISFYASLSLTILGICSTSGLGLRMLLFPREQNFQKVKTSLRQGLWLAGIACASLMLQRFKLLTWWNIAILASAFLVLELLFHARKNTPNEQS